MSILSRLLMLAPALLLASSAQAKPTDKPARAKTAATPSVPVVELATYQIAPAPGVPKLLVHLWGAPRKSPTNSGDIGARWKREESPFEMAISPFVYDIFAANGKGGWNYLTTFVHRSNRIPDAPSVRYLNNKTKTGYVFEAYYSDMMNHGNLKIYTFPDMNDADDYSVWTMYPTSPTGGVRTEVGYSRDARGYVQLVSAEKGYGNGRTYDIRTVFNWDEANKNWQAQSPVTTTKKIGD